MTSDFIKCKTSMMSKIGRYAAEYLYPSVGIGLLLISCYLTLELFVGKYRTIQQLIVYLLTIIVATSLAVFLFAIGISCYRMETRKILIQTTGFQIKEKAIKWYAWENVQEIAVIAFAANANMQNYQTQICIFLNTPNHKNLKKLRGSYLYGAFNRDRYVLLDYNPGVLEELCTCSGLSAIDLRDKQLQ